MKKIIITLLFCLTMVSSVFAWRDNEMQVRVFYNNDMELQQLIKLNAEGDIYPNGEALLYLVPSEFGVLKSTDLKYQIENMTLKHMQKIFGLQRITQEKHIILMRR